MSRPGNAFEKRMMYPKKPERLYRSLIRLASEKKAREATGFKRLGPSSTIVCNRMNTNARCSSPVNRPMRVLPPLLDMDRQILWSRVPHTQIILVLHLIRTAQTRVSSTAACTSHGHGKTPGVFQIAGGALNKMLEPRDRISCSRLQHRLRAQNRVSGQASRRRSLSLRTLADSIHVLRRELLLRRFHAEIIVRRML